MNRQSTGSGTPRSAAPARSRAPALRAQDRRASPTARPREPGRRRAPAAGGRVRVSLCPLEKRNDAVVQIALGEGPAKMQAHDPVAVDGVGLGHAAQAPIESDLAVEV